MRVLLAATLLAILAGCATVPAPHIEPPAQDAAHAAWARVLDRYVDDRGRVDFAGLARKRADLDQYVAFVAATPAETFAPGAARLAHHLNAYNALSMWNVIESGIPQTHAGFAKLRFFVLRKLPIGGESMSLYAYENEVIRPLGEPRVHFALNCNAVSCPVLPRRPFDAARLDAELEREARAFFARPENYRVDDATRTVWLSALLEWFEEDFVPRHAPSVAAYASRYAPRPAPPGYAVRFLPYDWTIAARPAGAR